MIDTERLKDFIREGVVTVKFEKKDGTIREMTCSTNPDVLVDHLPTNKETVESTKRDENLMVVFDLVKKDWRSFKLDKVQSWEVL